MVAARTRDCLLHRNVSGSQGVGFPPPEPPLDARQASDSVGATQGAISSVPPSEPSEHLVHSVIGHSTHVTGEGGRREGSGGGSNSTKQREHLTGRPCRRDRGQADWGQADSGKALRRGAEGQPTARNAGRTRPTQEQKESCQCGLRTATQWRGCWGQAPLQEILRGLRWRHQGAPLFRGFWKHGRHAPWPPWRWASRTPRACPRYTLLHSSCQRQVQPGFLLCKLDVSPLPRRTYQQISRHVRQQRRMTFMTKRHATLYLAQAGPLSSKMRCVTG